MTLISQKNKNVRNDLLRSGPHLFCTLGGKRAASPPGGPAQPPVLFGAPDPRLIFQGPSEEKKKKGRFFPPRHQTPEPEPEPEKIEASTKN